jgi:cytochrome c-type biogenesis protein
VPAGIEEGLGAWWGPALAFAAGAFSFASPCVLPLVPGYLALVSGGRDTDPASGKADPLPVLLFIAGFTIVFTVGFGIAAGSISRWFRSLIGQRVAGTVVAALGLFMLAYAQEVTAPWLYRERHPILERIRPGRTTAFPLGMAFAVGWTPCVGPVLGGILALAAAQEAIGRAILLLFFYSLGLGLPFLLLGLGVQRVLATARIFSRHYRWFAGVSGAILVSIGMLLVTGLWVHLLSPVLRLVTRFTPAI